MKTDIQLLKEYTDLVNDDWKRLHRKDNIMKAIEANNKEASRLLRVALRRLVRNTGWTVERCSYWVNINHSTRPVTMTLQGTVELYHFEQDPRRLCKLEVGFAPADEERTLLYLEAIINATKP